MKRGEIWYINFSSTIGHEQSGMRPAVVISDNNFNDSFLDLAIVCPLTTKYKGFPSHVHLADFNSYVKVEDVRSLSKLRFSKKIGEVTSKELIEIEVILRYIQGL